MILGYGQYGRRTKSRTSSQEANATEPLIHPIKQALSFRMGFFLWIMGFEERGPPVGWVKKCPVDTFLARGENPIGRRPINRN